MTKSFSEMLIERGVQPGMKKYTEVRPRGIYMLLPSMWHKAKSLEQLTDTSYDELMNEYRIAVAKQQLTALQTNQPDEGE